MQSEAELLKKMYQKFKISMTSLPRETREDISNMKLKQKLSKKNKN